MIRTTRFPKRNKRSPKKMYRISASFKLYIRSLAGNEYRMTVTPSQSIHVVKQLLLNKIIHDPSYTFPFDPSTTILTLTIPSENESFTELMDDKKIGDYPLTSDTIVNLVIHTGKGRVHVMVMAPHDTIKLRIDPTATIRDVKQQIYGALVDEPYYKTQEISVDFTLRLLQDGNWITIRDLRTVESYPGFFEQTPMLEMIMNDELFRAYLYKKVSKYMEDTIGSISFTYLESVEEFKQRIADKFNLTEAFHLKMNNKILKEDSYLYEYSDYMDNGVGIYVENVENVENIEYSDRESDVSYDSDESDD